jgi:hypothetical protein
MDKGEPPSLSTSTTSLFIVGRDRDGHWIARDQGGLRGGLFVDRAEAVKFAMFENGNRPQAVVTVPGVIELDMKAKPRLAQHSAVIARTPLRQVA